MMTMNALVLGDTAPQLVRRPRPAPGTGEVLVRIRAAGLNRADLLIVSGHFHGGIGGAGIPLGLEFAGEIVALGAGVDDWRVGDRVMASGRGAFADYIVAYAAMLWRVPDALSFEQAAAFPIALQTTHDAIVTHGGFRRGQSLLVLGASSGVGLMALQLGALLGAGQIIGTSTDAAKRGRLSNFGATAVLDTAHDGWSAQALEHTAGAGVDLAIDFLSGETVNATMAATALGGRIVNVGRLAGSSASFDFDLHARRRLTYTGVTFRSRSKAEITALVHRARNELELSLSLGAFAMPIDDVLPLSSFEAAFEKMVANRHFGKVLLTPEETVFSRESVVN